MREAKKASYPQAGEFLPNQNRKIDRSRLPKKASARKPPPRPPSCRTAARLAGAAPLETRKNRRAQRIRPVKLEGWAHGTGGVLLLESYQRETARRRGLFPGAVWFRA